MSGIDDKIQTFMNNMDIVHEVVHGDTNALVQTQRGLIPSLAKTVNDATSGALSIATTAATNATNAKVAAEAARDSVNTTGKVFADTTAGIAGTTTTQTFAVIDSSANFWIIYKNNAGVAQEVARSYTKAYIDGLGAMYPSLDTWVELTVDNAGRPVKGKKSDGTLWEARSGVMTQVQSALLYGSAPLPSQSQLQGLGLEVQFPTLDTWKNVVVDSTNRVVYGEKFDGTIWRAVAGVLTKEATVGNGSGTTQLPMPSYSYDYTSGTALSLDADVDYMVIINGQSLALGSKSGTAGDATITTTAQHPGYALMFDQGTIPSGFTVSKYVDLYEQDYRGSFETVCSGMADVLMTGMQTRFGRKPRVLWAVAGQSGTAYWDARSASYQGLKRGTPAYTETLRLISRAKEISAVAGRRLVVLAQVVIHGEQDFNVSTPRALYIRALHQWRLDMDEDIRRITGQQQQLRQLVSQTNRGQTAKGAVVESAWAQLLVEDQTPLARCVGPIYDTPTGTDGSHTTGLGYRMMGRRFGHWMLNDLFGPYEQPLRVIDQYWVSNTVFRLKYSKDISIETSDALVNISTLSAGKGIDFTDSSITPPTITGIALAANLLDTVEVTLSGPPVGKRPKATIAMWRNGSSGMGSTMGARSGIRSLNSFTTDPLTGVVQYHWACQEQITLPTI